MLKILTYPILEANFHLSVNSLRIAKILYSRLAVAWSSLFLLHAFALTALFLAKVRLSLTLTLLSHHLVTWTDGSVSFPCGIGGSHVLANFLVLLFVLLTLWCRGRLFLRQAQFVQAYLLSPGLFFKLSAGLGSTHKPDTFLLLLSGAPSVLATFFSLLFYLAFCGTSGRNFFLSFCGFISLQLVSGYFFLSGYDTTDELARRDAVFQPSAVPCSLLPLVSPDLFCPTGDVIFHHNSSTSKFLQHPLKSMSFLVTLVVSSLIFATTVTAYC